MKRRRLLALSATAAFWATVSAYIYLAERSAIRFVRRLMNITDDDTPDFPGDYQGYRVSENLDLQSIEANSWVTDDPLTGPGRPFGYLNEQWQAFKGLVECLRLRYGSEVEVVEYRIPLTDRTLERHLVATGSQVKWPESVVYAARYRQKVVHTFWASGAQQRDF